VTVVCKNKRALVAVEKKVERAVWQDDLAPAEVANLRVNVASPESNSLIFLK